MKKLLGVLISLIGLSSVVAQVPKEKALLWEITGKGIKQPSYLFGTIHLMCPDEFLMPDVIRKKFNTTKQLYLEIDLNDPNMMQEMMVGMRMKGDTTIDKLMDAVTYDSISKIFQAKAGMPLMMMKNAKPMLLMSLIYPSMMGCQPKSWESVFQQMAKDKNMKLFGLEKMADQINVFEKIPYQVQADMLVKTMYNVDSSKLELAKMLDVYKAKDINKMYEMTTGDEQFGAYESLLLTDRNKSWIPVITAQVKKMPTFFACGGGHLGGPNGVIALLRKKGLTVKPVFYK